MPLSDRRFDAKVEEFLKENSFDKYFDIGVGAGKYGKMIKSINPKSWIVGVEVDREYIEKYNIGQIYDEVINDRIENFIKANPAFVTDVAILGDLLEHLFKSDGVDLLHYLIYRCKYLVIVFPSKFVMFDYRGHASEAHNSIWNESDFKEFDYQYFKDGIMNMVIIKGFWSDNETVYNL